MDSMFSTLLQLPLFQGLSQEDFTNILGKVKLHFTKHKQGDVVVKSQDPCNKLIFLLKGEIVASTFSEKENLVFQERIISPYLIEPYSLFGLEQVYRSTYIVSSREVNMLSIDKTYVAKELLRYEIFRINFMNIICSRTQNIQNRLCIPIPNDVKAKVLHFIYMHSERPDGEKVLRIKMDDLARNLDDTRLNVSRALNELQDEKLLVLRRKEILIPEAAALFA